MTAEAIAAGALAAIAMALVVPRVARIRPGSGASDSLATALRVLEALRFFLSKRLTTRRRRQRTRSIVRESVMATATELRAGQSVSRALQRGFAPGVGPRALAALEWGGDVAAALRADGSVPGCALLTSVAACWSVAEGRGAGLAAALERLVETDRAAEEVRAQLDAHLAAPRATARMLAVLPVLGLLLGIGFGGDPIGWLLGSAPGVACLLGGLLLIGLGLLWTSRIVARVERQL